LPATHMATLIHIKRASAPKMLRNCCQPSSPNTTPSLAARYGSWSVSRPDGKQSNTSGFSKQSAMLMTILLAIRHVFVGLLTYTWAGLQWHLCPYSEIHNPTRYLLFCCQARPPPRTDGCRLRLPSCR
jgi:hypothetical protein